MGYFSVWVRSIQYHSNEALTYRYDGILPIGSVVRVELRKERVLGIVMDRSSRPAFSTKPIIAVISIAPFPLETLALARWLRAFYPTTIGAVTSLLLPQSIPEQTATTQPQTPFSLPERLSLPPLTAQQVSALDTMRNPDTYILHGRTGSGKTRIYTEIAQQTITAGRSVIMLVPEIGLTSQLAANFEHIFGNRVVILHSRLTAAQRRDAWLHIATAKQPLIVIGPRSALFSPLHNMGAILIDEAHDQAYKQEQAPYYHAIRVASRLRSIYDAILILGSATPAVVDYYVALNKRKPIIKIQELAKPQAHPPTLTVVDLKERSQFTRTPHLSLALIEAMSYALRHGQQTLLYLNRRGTARIALCQTCGWRALCPHCDIPFTYHGDSHTLRCHICGYHTAAVTTCPACTAPLTFRSFGTKAIVNEVQSLFPEARTLRFDADNVKADRLERQYQRIRNGEADILVGTQMLAKGLDLPRLSTLGVLLADSSLYIPDYTAQEQTYQLITQVIGRVGRGHTHGHIIVQTYQPESDILKAALHNDWDNFYNNEIRERRRYFFPPFCFILKLTCKRASSLSAERAAIALASHLKTLNLSLHVEGPAPAFHEKSDGKYKWQIIIKSSRRADLLRILGELPKSGWSYDIDPSNLL